VRVTASVPVPVLVSVHVLVREFVFPLDVPPRSSGGFSKSSESSSASSCRSTE
jgi:hypothetical protein